jgi:hypothetical protein
MHEADPAEFTHPSHLGYSAVEMDVISVKIKFYKVFFIPWQTTPYEI